MLRSLISASESLYTCLVVPKAGSYLTRWNRTIPQGLHTGIADSRRLAGPSDTEQVQASEDKAVSMEDLKPESLFPTAETHSMVIEGRRYDELPIIHIKATQNNTIISLTKHTGDVITQSSGGMEGFRNARKGTNIAGQAAGVSAGQKALKNGLPTVRVCVRGLGPGRLPAIKGLQMAGVNIVSITDTTRINQRGPRPRKQRRL